MLYSRRCEYAIRALSYLANDGRDELTQLSEIAEAQDLPEPFARKIFRDLVRSELLTSARGPGGGYALARSPSETSLLEIREAVDGTADLENCAVGLNPCTDATPCPLHETWKPLREELRRYLEATSLADIAEGWEVKLARMREGSGDAGETDDAPGP